MNVKVIEKKRKILSTFEMSNDTYKREALDNIWEPPKSSYESFKRNMLMTKKVYQPNELGGK